MQYHSLQYHDFTLCTVECDIYLILFLVIGILFLSCQVIFRLLHYFLFSFSDVYYRYRWQDELILFSGMQYQLIARTSLTNTTLSVLSQTFDEDFTRTNSNLHSNTTSSSWSYLAASRSLCWYGMIDVSISVVSKTINFPFLPRVSGILGNLRYINRNIPFQIRWTWLD